MAPKRPDPIKTAKEFLADRAAAIEDMDPIDADIARAEAIDMTGRGLSDAEVADIIAFHTGATSQSVVDAASE